MKNLLKFFSALILLLVIPVMVFAQDGGEVLNGLDLKQYFESLAAMVPLVVLITSFVKKVIDVQKPWIQIISWIISITLAFIGYLLNLGIFAGVEAWYMVALYGFAIGLAANGFFDITLIQKILAAIGLEPKKDVSKSYLR